MDDLKTKKSLKMMLLFALQSSFYPKYAHFVNAK
jgi:hypothetical protein